MANDYFQFKQFIIRQDQCAMKVTTDACLFGAWLAEKISCHDAGKKNILDIGAGTGLLSLMIAQACGMHIDAVEIDEQASAQATENVAASPWSDRLSIINGDINKIKFTHSRSYDIIISNPPFYENELASGNSRKNLAHHNEGLLLHDLLAAIQENLATDGRFFLMLPGKRMKDLGLLLSQFQLCITNTTLVKQSTKHASFRVFIEGKRASDEHTEVIIDEIAIRGEDGDYTTAFRLLLKDYYLHLV